MGNLTDDMTKLSREVILSRKAREAFVNGLKEGVSEMLADFGKTRTEMDDTIRAEQRESFDKVKSHVNGIRTNAEELVDRVRNVRGQMSKKMSSERRAFLKRLHADVGELMSGFSDALSRVASMAHAERACFVSDLKDSVSDLKDKSAEFHEKVAEDILGARHAWSAGNRPDEKHQKPRRRAPEHTLKIKVERRAPMVKADDLTVISGIGAEMQRHLNRAGIRTFAQLARTAPADLRGAVGKSSCMVQEWIAAARKRAVLNRKPARSGR